MKEIKAWAGDHIQTTIKEALKNIPCFFIFNGVRVEAVDSMKDHPEAGSFLYKFYNESLLGKDPPVWSVKPAEKPCKQCGKNCFLTDKKCWWCETPNPCK